MSHGVAGSVLDLLAELVDNKQGQFLQACIYRLKSVSDNDLANLFNLLQANMLTCTVGNTVVFYIMPKRMYILPLVRLSSLLSILPVFAEFTH